MRSGRGQGTRQPERQTKTRGPYLHSNRNPTRAMNPADEWRLARPGGKPRFVLVPDWRRGPKSRGEFLDSRHFLRKFEPGLSHRAQNHLAFRVRGSHRQLDTVHGVPFVLMLAWRRHWELPL